MDTTTLLDTLKIEIANAEPNKFLPKDEPSEGEQVVGTLPEDLQRFWTVVESYRKAGVEAYVAYMMASKSEREQRFRELHLVTLRTQIVKELFWLTVREKFDLLSNIGVGLRSGWRIVAIPAKASPTIIGFGF